MRKIGKTRKSGDDIDGSHLFRRVPIVAVVSLFYVLCTVSPSSLALGNLPVPLETDSCFKGSEIVPILTFQRSLHVSQEESRLLSYRKGPYFFEMGVLARGYYLNDQRIQWTGYETIMGAEGILTPSFVFNQGTWGVWSAHGEFYIQDTLHKNVLVDTAERQSYLGNVNHSAFELSQLHVRYRNSFFEFQAGKFESPFGHYVVPLMSNSRWDAPFIRTESILWRDTGFLFRFTPSIFDICFAVTNGCDGLDTNSMKAGTGRLGLNFTNVTLGISAFWQDGEGSEEQKQYRNHAGVDAMVRFGNWTLSSEIIYDEYGLRRDFNPGDIFWERSIYYRQINKGDGIPITGWGGYVDLMYNDNSWFFSLNYGEYHPERLRQPGYPQHDIINRRFLAKIGWSFTKHLQWYNALLFETEGHIAQDGRPRKGTALLSGVKMEF